MKSFSEYLTESKKTYSFSIKICGELPESADKGMKSAMHQFSVNKLSKGKTTPIQAVPLDFPGQSNVEVHVFEVDLAYPATSNQLREMIADQLKISTERIRVRNPLEQAEIDLNLEHNSPTEEALLDKPYEPSDNQGIVGEKGKMAFLNTLKNTGFGTEYKGTNDQLLSKSVPKEKPAAQTDSLKSISPIGSRQNKVPDPYQGR